MSTQWFLRFLCLNDTATTVIYTYGHARSRHALFRSNLRLLLSGPASSAGRPMSDGATPGPGGWNRIHRLVDDIASEVSRLRDAGVSFRNDVVTGPGGSQVLVEDPAGNFIELFQPAER